MVHAVTSAVHICCLCRYSTLLFGTRAMEIVTTPTLRVTQEVSDAILTRKATPDVVIPTPIPTMRRGSVRDDDDDEDEEDTSCGTSSQRVTLPVSALPWKTTVPTSSS